MTTTYREFVDNKQRKAKKHLGLVKRLLEKQGFQVTDRAEERDDPHIFVFNPDKNLSFDGVRIYEIGGDIAYRVQKEAETHPFGKAYSLPIEKMYEDLLGDEEDEDKIGEEIIKSVSSELKEFFEKSAKAEKDGPWGAEDPLGKVYARSTGTDYSNQVHNIEKR